MKTPLTELIEILEKEIKEVTYHPSKFGLHEAIAKARELLPKERRVIKTAFSEGKNEVFKTHVENEDFKSSEDYFTQTFEQ